MVGKVFESVIRDIMIKYLLNENLISGQQHEFMSMRSCITQLMDDWIDTLEGGSAIDVI